MIVSETKGRLCSLEYDSSKGLMLTAEWYQNEPYPELSQYTFPWNRNTPRNLDLNSLQGKKVVITVEIIEDEKKV